MCCLSEKGNNRGVQKRTVRDREQLCDQRCFCVCHPFPTVKIKMRRQQALKSVTEVTVKAYCENELAETVTDCY